MNRYDATLRLWKEARHGGAPDAQLEHFRRFRDRVMEIPEGVDLSQTVDMVIRLKNRATNLTLEGAIEEVIRAIRQGMDPLMIEESLRFILQSQGGFSRIELARFIFQYTLPQIRAGRAVWELLPVTDRMAIQVDTLLGAGLEDHPDVVTLVIQEMQSLQGLGLKVAILLKDCASPSVAFELWKSIRPPGAMQVKDLELLAQTVEAVGQRPTSSDHDASHIMGEEEMVSRFGRHAS